MKIENHLRKKIYTIMMLGFHWTMVVYNRVIPSVWQLDRYLWSIKTVAWNHPVQDLFVTPCLHQLTQKSTRRIRWISWTCTGSINGIPWNHPKNDHLGCKPTLCGYQDVNVLIRCVFYWWFIIWWFEWVIHVGVPPWSEHQQIDSRLPA